MKWDQICTEALGYLSMSYDNSDAQAFACNQARQILDLRAEAQRKRKMRKVNKMLAVRALGALWARS